MKKRCYGVWICLLCLACNATVATDLTVGWIARFPKIDYV